MILGRIPLYRTTLMARRPRLTHSAAFKAQVSVAAIGLPLFGIPVATLGIRLSLLHIRLVLGSPVPR
jgi:hypothetical protein